MFGLLLGRIFNFNRITYYTSIDLEISVHLPQPPVATYNSFPPLMTVHTKRTNSSEVECS